MEELNKPCRSDIAQPINHIQSSHKSSQRIGNPNQGTSPGTDHRSGAYLVKIRAEERERNEKGVNVPARSK